MSIIIDIHKYDNFDIELNNCFFRIDFGCLSIQIMWNEPEAIEEVEYDENK